MGVDEGQEGQRFVHERRPGLGRRLGRSHRSGGARGGLDIVGRHLLAVTPTATVASAALGSATVGRRRGDLGDRRGDGVVDRHGHFLGHASAGRRRLRHRHGQRRRRRGTGTTPLPPGRTLALDGAPADRAAHRGAQHEDPAHVGYGLAPDQASLVEQPVVVAVELLVGVVGQDGCPHLVGDGEDEGIASSDRACGWAHQFVVLDGGVELGHFRRIDSMTEGGINHHGDLVVGELPDERHDRLAELREAGHGSTFGGDVRTVYHDVSRHNDDSQPPDPPNMRDHP